MSPPNLNLLNVLRNESINSNIFQPVIIYEKEKFFVFMQGKNNLPGI